MPLVKEIDFLRQKIDSFEKPDYKNILDFLKAAIVTVERDPHQNLHSLTDKKNVDDLLSLYETEIIEDVNFYFLGAGDYNDVYKYYDTKLKKNMVAKIPREFDSRGDLHDENELQLDKVYRAVRLWNLINDHLEPKAKIIETVRNGKLRRLWTCPYVEGSQPSTQEICDTVITIFNKTGRIILDAKVEDNFIKTPDGKIVCIDIGFALQLEERDMNPPGLTRSKSAASLLFAPYIIDRLKHYKNSKKDAPINNLIKILLVIKSFRPDIMNVDFLKTHQDLANQLLEAYNDNDTLFTALEALKKLVPDVSKETEKGPSSMFWAPSEGVRLMPTITDRTGEGLSHLENRNRFKCS